MRVWSGTSLSSKAPPGTERVLISPCTLRMQPRLNFVCSTRPMRKRVAPSDHHRSEYTDKVWARVSAGCAGRPALRIPVAWSVRSVKGPPVQPEQGGARPVCQVDQRATKCAGLTSSSGTSSTTRRPISRSTTAIVHPTPRWRSSSIRPSRGAMIAPRGPPWHKTLIYEATCEGGLRNLIRPCRKTCAAVMPGSRQSRRSSI